MAMLVITRGYSLLLDIIACGFSENGLINRKEKHVFK